MKKTQTGTKMKQTSRLGTVIFVTHSQSDVLGVPPVVSNAINILQVEVEDDRTMDGVSRVTIF